MHAKVNPPIRPREDVEALWQAVLDGKVDWVVSDHACCRPSRNGRRTTPTTSGWPSPASAAPNICSPACVSEGSKRGLSYNRMAELLSWNPARRFGLTQQGRHRAGLDADIVLVDPHESFVVRAAEFGIQAGLHAVRGPVELSGRVKSTFLRGALVYENGNVVGPARGRISAADRRSNRHGHRQTPFALAWKPVR